jgi:ribosomal protein S18 acetylase RimI-like enzyme
LTNHSYVIKNHTPEQIDALAAFIERYLKTYPDAKLLSAGLYTYHPAVDNGQNVFLAFDAGGQVRGFAKALIARGLVYLRENGYDQVFLEVKQHNLPAVSVYRALGYQITNQEVLLGRFLDQ